MDTPCCLASPEVGCKGGAECGVQRGGRIGGAEACHCQQLAVGANFEGGSARFQVGIDGQKVTTLGHPVLNGFDSRRQAFGIGRGDQNLVKAFGLFGVEEKGRNVKNLAIEARFCLEPLADV